MDIKAIVAAALDGKTPDQKIMIACRVVGKDVAFYSHLDNGRKSMTAGNLLRAALKGEDEMIVDLLDSVACNIEDVIIDRSGHLASEGEEPTLKQAGPAWIEMIDPAPRRVIAGVECIQFGNAWVNPAVLPSANGLKKDYKGNIVVTAE